MVCGPANPRNANHAAPPRSAFAAFLLALFAANEKPHAAARKPPVRTALWPFAAIDDPGRFSSSKKVGAHFGLTPTKYQSGETDLTGRISKRGDKGVRAVLYEAAHIILTMPVKGGAFPSLGRGGETPLSLTKKRSAVRCGAKGEAFDGFRAG
jgi:hypothetical protein